MSLRDGLVESCAFVKCCLVQVFGAYEPFGSVAAFMPQLA